MVLSRKQANAMAMNNGLANNISSVSSSFSTPENGTETVGRQVKWIRSILMSNENATPTKKTITF